LEFKQQQGRSHAFQGSKTKTEYFNENQSVFPGPKWVKSTEREEVSSRSCKIEKSLFGRNQFVKENKE